MTEAGEWSSAEVVAVCRQLYGEISDVRDASWPHGESRVVLFTGADGVRRVAKRSRRAGVHRREVEAYRSAVPALAPNAPTLLYEDPGRQLLVTSFLEGHVVEGSAHDDEDVHLAAGRLVRRLHEAQPARWSRSYAGDLAVSLDDWVRRGEGLVTAAEVGAVRPIVERARHVGPVPLVLSHGDNTSRNWLLHPRHGLCLIDFGHARWAHWTVDVNRLRTGLWRTRPDLATAFLTGYGATLSPADTLVAEALAASAAISTIVWAHEHHDPAFEAQGRAMVTALGG